jgi:hypothetical protein
MHTVMNDDNTAQAVQARSWPRDGSVLRPRPRRRHLGRNIQFHIKATSETIVRFTTLADKHGLMLGELLARALDAFEARPRS